jgi:hypothetical protein
LDNSRREAFCPASGNQPTVKISSCPNFKFKVEE